MKLYNLILLCSITILIMSLALIYELTSLRARQEMREAQSRLAQAGRMSALGEMAGGIAHEINNPLTVIQLSSLQIQDILTEKDFHHPLIEERLGTIHNTVSRIATIILALRNFSKDGSLDNKQAESLGHILEATTSLCSKKFSTAGIYFDVDCPISLVQIECRLAEISQALLNLLNNAYDAAALADKKWIRIQCREVEGQAAISVQDSGAGITNDIQEKIFQPFFTTKDIGNGKGLGLSISRSLVEANGGTLTLDTAAENTSFVMRFPKAG